MKILTGANNKILRTKSEPVKHLTADIKLFINDMFECMKENNGVGLSAIQVGRPLQIIVFLDIDTNKLYTLINPKITKESKELVDIEEGCLSLPDVWAVIERPEKISVEGKNIDGKKIKLKLDNIVARVVQHEIDHLSGILFTDKTDKPYKQPLNKQTKL